MQSIKDIAKDCDMKFGKFIKTRREELNLPQIEVASKIGVTQVQLSYIESGSRRVDLSTALAICDILQLDIKEFIDNYNRR
jgi:transcriptional regulator with XRE-family HTH domain